MPPVNGGLYRSMGRETQPLRAAPAWSEGISNETSVHCHCPHQCRSVSLRTRGDHQSVHVTGGSSSQAGLPFSIAGRHSAPAQIVLEPASGAMQIGLVLGENLAALTADAAQLARHVLDANDPAEQL